VATVGVQRVTFSGERAVVRLGYQRAARLGAWTIEGGWLSAAVDDFDGFRITQSPLTLEIQYATGAPTYRALADVTVSGGRLTGRLLPTT
jgi:hypothetical protein